MPPPDTPQRGTSSNLMNIGKTHDAITSAGTLVIADDVGTGFGDG